MMLSQLYQKLHTFYLKHLYIVRFNIAFFGAILASIIVNDIPFFSNLLAESQLTTLLLHITGNLTLFFLELFNYNYIVDGILIQIKDTNGVLIVFGCLAYRHIIIFSVFIVLFLGKFYHKLWFILVGIISLILMNAFRIFLIAISQVPFPEQTEEIHFYLTRLVMYGLLFLLWFIWIKRFEYK